MKRRSFPADFVWGTSTSAYQIEGAWNDDGKGKSVWDYYCRRLKIAERGETGDVAIDHYHRYREDVSLMKELGLQSYRFSTSWPRILPEGIGTPNQKGVDFYSRLIDELLSANIEPVICLYHWDYPLALANRGGWDQRDSIQWFIDYAALCFKKYGDRVKKWMSMNEPWVDIFAAEFMIGKPTVEGMRRSVNRSHHYNTAHAGTVDAFRDLVTGGNIGLAFNLSPIYTEKDSDEDREAAERYDGFMNRWFLEPMLRGNYPDDMLSFYQERFSAPAIEPSDMDLMRNNIMDFIGVNYYTRHIVRRSAVEPVLNAEVVEKRDETWATNGEVYPEGLYEVLMRLGREYDQPIYITENGTSFGDEHLTDGKLNDHRRIEYLKSHLEAAHRALSEGVKLKGYYLWSIFDNFEWVFGYGRRFGIIYVDFKTQERIWKESARWYQTVIQSNGIPL